MTVFLAAIGDKIFWQFSVFPCNFDSSQAKENLISSITNFVCELPHELPNDLKLGILKY